MAIRASGFAAVLSILCPAAPSAVAAPADTIVGVERVVYPGQTLDGVGVVEIALRRPLAAHEAVAREAADLAGKVAGRTILPGRAVPLSFLRDPFLVEAGKPAQVIYRQGAVQIGMTGVALNAGSAGDSVRVRNARSGVAISGIVTQNGAILVGGP